MGSTGEKTALEKSESQAMPVDLLVRLCAQDRFSRPVTRPSTLSESYTNRLKREYEKIISLTQNRDADFLKRFKDHSVHPILKLKKSQILEAAQSEKHLCKLGDTIPPVHAGISNDNNPLCDTPTQIKSLPRKATRRTVPYPKKTHVRVKIITQDIDLNNGYISAGKTESITWMQRDVIKHYLYIQDIEKKRAANKGAARASP